MLQYLFCLLLVAPLEHTFGFPAYQESSKGGGRFEEDQTVDVCFIHAKIWSCQQAKEVELQLEGTSPVPLLQLDLQTSEEGKEQDVCLPVPCIDGQLTESMKISATPRTISNLDIVVSPAYLDSSFESVQKDSSRCFGDQATPADVKITCIEKPSGSDKGGFMGYYLQQPGTEEANSQNYITSDGYNNEYDKRLSFDCGSYRAVNSIQSKHSNSKEDRKFKFTCHEVTPYYDSFTMRYETPQYVNDYDQPIAFTCPINYVMCGIYSDHNNDDEDRRWKFNCCYKENYVTQSCVSTGYLNDFDAEFHFDAGDSVFTGVQSYHDNKSEDRRWSIIYCKYVKSTADCSLAGQSY